MAVLTDSKTEKAGGKRTLVEMNWDPVTRIVGSLGIYTKIDFANREVAECYSTSSMFRGYSVFMKGKDPRDAHFITSRICGICGDNHAVCSCYAQQMAYGVKPPPLGEWIVNLGEAAEYIFDHIIFQDNLVFVDFCEEMVRATNPSVWAKAEKADAPHAELHGYRTVADTRIGERTSVDLGNVKQIVDKLNERDPDRYIQIPLRDELYPLPNQTPR